MRIVILSTLVLVALFRVESRAQSTSPGWRPGTSLPGPLAGHSMLLLPTGDLLVTGGIDAGGSASRFSYLYSPIDGSFRPTLNQLPAPRAYHAVVAATAGGVTRVFSIGGYSGGGGGFRSEASVDLLELDAGAANWRWRTIGALTAPRGDLRATWDGGGSIIVTGGYAQSGGPLRSGARSTACERIDVAALRVEAIGSMSSPRAEHTTARFIGDNGTPQVLTAGGEDLPSATATQVLQGTAWDPIANPPLAYHAAGVGVGDPAGIARVFGGLDAAGAPLAACEWYDVKRGWRSAPRMVTPRARFDATLVAGVADTAAAYLATAGMGPGGALAGCELFNLPTAAFPNGAWVPFASLLAAGSERRVAIGGDNLAVVMGGRGASGAPLAGVEIYQPLRANDVAFGDEEIGRRSDSVVVTIENTWLLPVRVRDFRIAGSAEFSYRGDTSGFILSPGGRRTLRLYFQPGLAGERRGALLFDVGALTDTVQLSGRGIASQLEVINSPIDFGTHLLGSTQSLCTYVLRNNGTDTALIDSVVLASAGALRLRSPLGRVALPPGDSLRVCVEFTPSERGPVDAGITINIAARSFPLQVMGRGSRRYLTASVISSECDTVLYAPGAAISGFVRLENRGDTLVHLDAPMLKGSANGLFRLADPTLFPRDMAPGEIVQVEVIFTPQRESREVLALDFPNNGDTAAGASLCFVARSRYLSVSHSSVDLGTICVGDTATAFITIENPGGFDSVALYSATITPAGALTVSGFTPGTLAPRAYLNLALRYVPGAAGTLAGSLAIANSRGGDVIVPITAVAVAPARFLARAGRATIGDTAILPIDIQGLPAGSAMRRARLALEYDAALLMPIDLVSLPGAPGLNESLSTLTITGRGRATLDLQWVGGLATDGAAFGLRCDVLRGDAPVASVAFDGGSGDGVCIARSSAAIVVEAPCRGSGGLIRSGEVEVMNAAPLPASDALSITLLTRASGSIRVELLDMFGAPVGELAIDDASLSARTLTMPVDHLPAGSYILRARSDGRTIASRMVMIAR